MPALMSDRSDPQPTPNPVAHVKREVDGSNLCGSTVGMGFVFEVGEELGDAWPYMSWCPTCAAAHEAGAV